MAEVPIYLPDGERVSFEWFIDDSGSLRGVSGMSDSWVTHWPRRAPAGFARPADPVRIRVPRPKR